MRGIALVVFACDDTGDVADELGHSENLPCRFVQIEPQRQLGRQMLAAVMMVSRSSSSSFIATTTVSTTTIVRARSVPRFRHRQSGRSGLRQGIMFSGLLTDVAGHLGLHENLKGALPQQLAMTEHTRTRLPPSERHPSGRDAQVRHARGQLERHLGMQARWYLWGTGSRLSLAEAWLIGKRPCRKSAGSMNCIVEHTPSHFKKVHFNRHGNRLLLPGSEGQ